MDPSDLIWYLSVHASELLRAHRDEDDAIDLIDARAKYSRITAEVEEWDSKLRVPRNGEQNYA